MLSVSIERMSVTSSAIPAKCGKSSLTSIPHLPARLNSQGEPNRLPVAVRSSFGFANGSGLPFSARRRGFGSNVSTWLGPPLINKKMTRFARAGKWGAFGASGLDVACAACAPSAPSKPCSANAPKPAPALRSRSRLDVGINSILLS